MKMKVWKGCHLNGPRLPQAETKENVEVLQSAELQADATFVKKIMMTKSSMLLHYKYTTLSNCYMIKKVLLVFEIIVLYSS